MSEENKVPAGSNNAGNVIAWMEKINQMIEKYGIKSILLTLMVLFLVIIVGYYAFNPEAMVKQVQKVIEKQSIEEVDRRIKADPEIRNELINLRESMKADRAFVLETHNGGSNLTGLNFLYVDLTYDEPIVGLEKRTKEYLNLRTSSYPMMSFIYDNDFWFGSVEEIKDIDPEIYYRLTKAGVKHLGMMMMYGVSKPSGCLGVAFYSNEVPDTVTVMKHMRLSANSIGRLLDARENM